MKKKKRVVFTGGPSGGKSSVIEILQRNFGRKVAAVPEAATILYGGGFPRTPGHESMRHIQRAIYYVVRELEDMTASAGDAPVMLCDRGTLDGMAYWPQDGQGFLESLGTTMERELGRYDMVLHLRSPGAAASYKLSGTRIESHKQALELDKKIELAWQAHPKCFIVNEEPNFIVKVNHVIEILQREWPEILK